MNYYYIHTTLNSPLKYILNKPKLYSTTYLCDEKNNVLNNNKTVNINPFWSVLFKPKKNFI